MKSEKILVTDGAAKKPQRVSGNVTAARATPTVAQLPHGDVWPSGKGLGSRISNSSLIFPCLYDLARHAGPAPLVRGNWLQAHSDPISCTLLGRVIFRLRYLRFKVAYGKTKGGGIQSERWGNWQKNLGGRGSLRAS